MLRLAGALLLTGGAAGLGLCAAGQLRGVHPRHLAAIAAKIRLQRMGWPQPAVF